MNLFDLMERFSSDQSCIEHLEIVRWDEKPICPHCSSEKVGRKREGEKIGRWNCHTCKSSFNVLSGTLFAGTKIPLLKWFVAISLMIDAKKSVSSCQMARHLGINQPSAWYMMRRIREEMNRNGKSWLRGIVSGKPRRRRDDGNLPPPSQRGRGTKKTPGLSAVECGGNVLPMLRGFESKGHIEVRNRTFKLAKIAEPLVNTGFLHPKQHKFYDPIHTD